MKHRFSIIAIVASLPLALTHAAEPVHPGSHAGHALGTVDFPVSCSKASQAGFDHAVALLHHMTYPQANEAFRKLVESDPTCAMAHWGVAMTLFQPLWPTRPDAAAMKRGLEAVTAAGQLQPPTLYGDRKSVV